MGTGEWIAFATLIFTISMTGIGVATRLGNNKQEILTQMSKNKEELDDELTAIRIASYEEYKTLRKEMGDASSLSSREFGETIHAIRAKITEVELWARDQFKDTRHTFYGAMDMRHSMITERIEKTDERVRQIELTSAAKFGFKEKI